LIYKKIIGFSEICYRTYRRITQTQRQKKKYKEKQKISFIPIPLSTLLSLKRILFIYRRYFAEKALKVKALRPIPT